MKTSIETGQVYFRPAIGDDGKPFIHLIAISGINSNQTSCEVEMYEMQKRDIFDHLVLDSSAITFQIDDVEKNWNRWPQTRNELLSNYIQISYLDLNEKA